MPPARTGSGATAGGRRSGRPGRRSAAARARRPGRDSSACVSLRVHRAGLAARRVMKLTGRDAARFLARPDRAAAGVLLHGVDAMRVALKRAALVEALIGPEGAAEMRLERIAAADLRREPALVLDALKATGFFAGRAGGAGRGCRRRGGAGAEGGARRLAGRGRDARRHRRQAHAGQRAAQGVRGREAGGGDRGLRRPAGPRRDRGGARRRRGWRGRIARPSARWRRSRRRSTPGTSRSSWRSSGSTSTATARP